MVYQYLGEEQQESARRMRRVVPYEAAKEAPPSDEDTLVAAAALPEGAANAPAMLPTLPFPSPIAKPPAGYVGAAPPSSRRPVVVPQNVPVPPVDRKRRTRTHVQDRGSDPADPPVPSGFAKSVSAHFVVFAEQYPASDRFIDLIESLHSNLMLDLAPFSPWAREERTTIFLFKSQDTYRRVTGRPAWSGGASSINKRKLYVYESEELPGIVAHELTHVYFDGFFIAGATDPLWLSEGMATLVQVERGLAAPNWLRENLQRLEQGEGLPIEQFVAVTTTAGWPDEKVRLWYAQAYSLVRFMIRTQYRSSFYKFAAHLRDGRPAPEALYRAYGAPYTRLKALEHAWRYELSRASMAKLSAQ